MKTVSSAHFGWSRLKVKATNSASRPEAAVFAAKIQRIQRGPMSGFAGSVSGPALDIDAAPPSLDPVADDPRCASARELIHSRPEFRFVGTVDILGKRTDRCAGQVE